VGFGSPRRGIHHAQSLRHVVERRRQQLILLAQAMDHERAGSAQAKQGQQHAVSAPSRQPWHERQNVGFGGVHDRKACGKANHACHADEQPGMFDRQRDVSFQHRSAFRWLTERSPEAFC